MGEKGLNELDMGRPLTDVAYRDKTGRWRAGPDVPGDYTPGQFIPTRQLTAHKADGSTYKRTVPAGIIGNAYHNIARDKHVKAVMRRQDLGEAEARQFIRETEAELAQARQEGRPERELIDIQRRLHGS